MNAVTRDTSNNLSRQQKRNRERERERGSHGERLSCTPRRTGKALKWNAPGWPIPVLLDVLDASCSDTRFKSSALQKMALLIPVPWSTETYKTSGTLALEERSCPTLLKGGDIPSTTCFYWFGVLRVRWRPPVPSSFRGGFRAHPVCLVLGSIGSLYMVAPFGARTDLVHSYTLDTTDCKRVFFGSRDKWVYSV